MGHNRDWLRLRRRYCASVKMLAMLDLYAHHGYTTKVGVKEDPNGPYTGWQGPRARLPRFCSEFAIQPKVGRMHTAQRS